MYISIAQVQLSLDVLSNYHPFFGMSFFAFKKASLPVGSVIWLNFTQIATDILERHYRPSSTYLGYYNPFFTSNSEKRWNSPRYPSTSLQRITKDTFGDALIHPTKSEWGWRHDYVERLQNHLRGTKLSAFHLGIWLFRSENWTLGATPADVVSRLFTEYSLSNTEIELLFESETANSHSNWLTIEPIAERELLSLIGPPPGSTPEEGAVLRSLALRGVGPGESLRYEPAERLNIITGDNSSGKTFLLDCVWWALTGEWLERPAMPRTNVSRKTPRIDYAISTPGGRSKEYSSNYDWERQIWSKPSQPLAAAGLVIYARFDGSFAVWDPARVEMADAYFASQSRPSNLLLFRRDDIWYGLSVPGKRDMLCNGLIRDWVTWQTSGSRYADRWQTFVKCLMYLSPSGEGLEPGTPTKLSISDADMPTVRLPYDEVPVIHASAGVQRALALAYILVWSWYKHLENSAVTRRTPQRRLVLAVDEVEAHLHPRWQRMIVPSLMSVLTELAPQVAPQIHIATHSPLVLASTEAIFTEDTDSLHHLRLLNRDVVLEELPFIKRGRVDLWLMSDVFGLSHARSQPAEEAIEYAKFLQRQDVVFEEQVRSANIRLIEHLAQDDDFWPRWRYYAKQHGVD